MNVLMIVRMNVAQYGKCRCCGEAAYCSHLDWELGGVICRACANQVIFAEIILLSWVGNPAPALIDWERTAMHPDGRYYNAPRKERAP